VARVAAGSIVSGPFWQVRWPKRFDKKVLRDSALA
jgi:hypothetical protein